MHIVHIADTYSWDAIKALSESNGGPMITSQNKPEGVPYDHWNRNISVLWYQSGEQMADAINAILSNPAGAPARVMIDEVRSASKDMVAACARRMRSVYPQWRGRWGAYIVTGEAIAYPNLQPAIDELLDAGAPLGVEMYAHQSRYCASGSTIAERDRWLGDYFHGSRGAFSQGRFHWLAQRRRIRGSESQLTVLFGVTDDFLDGRAPAKFLDRMFYVWATRSGYRGTILDDNGGPGAWKWDAPKMGNTSRDLAFAESFQHYSVEGRISSRLGPVPCD
jgi:hypothetical protein